MTQNDYTINVFNRQRRHKIQAGSLREFLCGIYRRLEMRAGFSVVLVSDAAMRKFNRLYAGNDRSTDVLAFPSPPCSSEEAYLGDIVISVETAQRQAKRSLQEELQVLSLHGVLHLMGYDHETDQGEMEEYEGALRREFGLQ